MPPVPDTTRPECRTVNAPMRMRAAETRPSSYQEADNSIEVVWTTGATVTRFDWWDWEYYNEELSLEPGAVRLDRLNAGASVIDSHDQNRLSAVLGSVVPGTVVVENSEGRCRVSLAQTPDVSDTVAKIIAGHIRNVSVGYIVHAYTRIERDGERATMRADDWEPVEISFVIVPADAGAQVRSQSHAPQGGFPCVIRGSAAANPEETNMPPENTQTPPAAPETVTPPQGNQRNDSVTASRIRDVVGRSNLGAEFALELISRNEATPLTEAQLTDAIMERLAGARPQGQIDGGNSVGPAGTEDESYRRAIETAVILRSNPSADVSTEDRENAREFRGMTLMEMGRDYLQRTGIAARGLDRLQLAGAALGMRSGALTTSDFAHALSNAANRRLRSAFEAAPQTFGGFVSRGTLPDFKEAPIVAFGDTPQLLLVKENGEFKRGSLADTGDSYKLATYGRIIPITRQCIVNDDLRVFDRIPAGFGRQAADLESDLVYAQLTGNPKMYDGKSLFHADHGNLAATGTAITEAALSAGEAAIMEQKSAEGGFLNLRPQFLIVGTAKKVEAQKILAAITATKSGDVNVFQNALTLVVDPRVAGKQWFLSVSPDAFDTIELANLEGQEGVYTETRVGFDVDGIEFKGRVDRVAKAIDWRGLYKNSGD